MHSKPFACRHLYFPAEQHPIVCQLGGSNPEKLAAAAKVVASYGYDEINLNCGCPSDRVAGAGCFGASLMLQPEAVGDACRAMREATGTDVTVKCRLGKNPQSQLLSIADVPGRSSCCSKRLWFMPIRSDCLGCFPGFTIDDWHAVDCNVQAGCSLHI